MDPAGHHETVRREFGKQARHFGEAGLTLSNEEYLRWTVDVLDPAPHWLALDVATGTGHLARALAPRVRAVTAVDLTPAMLAEGRRLAAEAGLGNVSFEEGAAERLPYPDASFDLVATRLSLHHMLDPAPTVAEMARVARPGGLVAVIDLVSPDNPELAARYNALERLRDPSHTRALTLAELTASLGAAGLAISQTLTRDVEAILERWLKMTHTPPDARGTILEALTAELSGGPPTGMRPFRRDGELRFLHSWAILVGVRS
ncbi:MAG TPA: methyltransferase domain-containing protein [Methylomirabilota bacterium]|nr:methyltransferase domain-containing protein [Methylomirabilota bacterium]